MSTMALTVQQISQIGLSVGMDLGFNCCMVQRRYDYDTFEPVLDFWWGDREHAPEMSRLVDDCVRSYSEEVPCIREPRFMTLREPIVEKSTTWLRTRFTEALLETAIQPEGEA